MARFTLELLQQKGFNLNGDKAEKKPTNLLNPIQKSKYKNKKQVNADGVKFDSKLEMHFYNLLKENDIEFKFQEKILLQNSFRYDGEAIREMAMIIDFAIIRNDTIIAMVDTKGMVMPDWKLKLKLLKKKLYDSNSVLPIYTPRNQKQCAETIIYIKEKVRTHEQVRTS